MSIVKNATIIGGSVLVAGVGASMLIPVAMTTFGTVVSGVGTIHMAGGGCCHFAINRGSMYTIEFYTCRCREYSYNISTF